MCTAFTLPGESLYFGRNMDLECGFGEAVVITPRNFPLSTKCAGTMPSHYSMIGMAHVADNYPLYAEAVNEKGLCAAGLNFPGNACYRPHPSPRRRGLAPYELIPYLLGRCGTLTEARTLLQRVELVEIPFRPDLPLAPLHWLVSDASGSLVVEQTAAGMQIYENPFGVLTNNPPFPFHCENARQYLGLSARLPENTFAPALSLSPFGMGAGAFGLPGDFSPASRFIKTLFCRMNSCCGPDPASRVAQVFHILDAVAMVRGTVLTREGKPDLTTYSCCMDAAAGAYYYKTYENSRITRVVLTHEKGEGIELSVFPIRSGPDYLEED